eukprot:3940251-Rhodomonas_salina.3
MPPRWYYPSILQRPYNAVSGPNFGYAPTRSDCYSTGTVSRACYAMSGTDVAYGCAISLRSCYAVSGTDLDRMILL